MDDAYILKLSPTGAFIWAKNITGVGSYSSGNGIKIDSNKNIYLTGRYEGTVDFDFSLNTLNLTSNIGNPDVFIYKISQKPNCATINSPINGSNNISTNPILTWSAPNGNFTGYFLSVGTSPSATNIFNKLDIGNVTNYQLLNLPPNTQIYCKIIPYNLTEEAIGCTEINFKTEQIFLKLSPKVYLNSMDTTTGLLNDYLRGLNNFPLTDPYSTSPLNTRFIHVNNSSISTVSSTILNQVGSNAIVDWIFLELRSKNNPATRLYTRVGLLQKDGDIVDMDGISPISFAGASADNYYIAVRHRNHLGFRTLNTVALSNTPVSLNFTNNSIALNGATPTTLVATNTYAMVSGDSNYDGSIDAFDTILWEQQNGLFDDYINNSDYNLDGSVDAFDTILWELNNGKFEELD